MHSKYITETCRQTVPALKNSWSLRFCLGKKEVFFLKSFHRWDTLRSMPCLRLHSKYTSDIGPEAKFLNGYLGYTNSRYFTNKNKYGIYGITIALRGTN